MKHTEIGFTIVELIIVTVIIGIISAFGAPLFTKTINRAKARDAINTLNLIYAANQTNKARTGTNITSANIAAINSDLGTNIVAQKNVSYNCSDGLHCIATGPGSVFVATLTLDNDLNKSTNPTCPQSICP